MATAAVLGHVIDASMKRQDGGAADGEEEDDKCETNASGDHDEPIRRYALEVCRLVV